MIDNITVPKSNKEKFDDIFRFEVDSTAKGKTLNRQLFWDELYISREEEKDVFNTFLNSDTTLLFLTGFVGSGKSTFIRAMYEKYKLCNGIIIDFKGHAEEFKTDDEDSISEKLNDIVKNSLLKQIRENIKYNLIRDKKKYKNYHYNPSFIPKLNEKEKEKWNNAYYEFETDLELFSLSLKHLFNEESISTLAFSKGISPDGSELWLTEAKRKAKESTEILSTFKTILTTYILIELLRKIQTDSEKLVITFDNIDAIKFNKIQRNFLDALINIENAANRRQSDGNIANLNPSPIKIVLNVRDENITRLNLGAAGAKRNLQLKLHEHCIDLDTASEIKLIKKEKEFFFKILSSRINIIKKSLEFPELDLIEKIITTHIIDITNSELMGGDDYVNLKEVSNESIRQMLDFISNLTFGLVALLKAKNIDAKNLTNHRVNLQGKVILFLWNFDTTKKVLRAISSSLKSEQNEDSICCSFRMCLTHLYNEDERQIEFSSLVNKMKKYLNTDEEDVRKSVFELYNSGFRESEMISIYQNRLIKKNNHITQNALVKLNLKGENLLNHLLKNIDFFGRVVENKHEFKNNSLIELIPVQALKYLTHIYEFVESLYNYHSSFLIDKIYPRIKHEFPFDDFQKHYCVGQALFIERVCVSHLNAIKNYIEEVFKGNQAILLVSEEERENLSQYCVDEGSTRNYRDEAMQNKIKNLPNGSGQVLNSIFSIVEKYEELQRKVVKLKQVKNTLANNGSRGITTP